jgi:hypothetical protein
MRFEREEWVRWQRVGKYFFLVFGFRNGRRVIKIRWRP